MVLYHYGAAEIRTRGSPYHSATHGEYTAVGQGATHTGIYRSMPGCNTREYTAVGQGATHTGIYRGRPGCNTQEYTMRTSLYRGHLYNKDIAITRILLQRGPLYNPNLVTTLT